MADMITMLKHRNVITSAEWQIGVREKGSGNQTAISEMAGRIN